MKIEGKAAVVTGSSRGVGRATVLSLARQGCSVLINYSRSREEAEQTAVEVRDLGSQAICFGGDVADDAVCREMMAAAVREFGRLDILVNNAAITRFIPHLELDRVTDEVWDRLFAVNVKGLFQCARAARPLIEQSGGGEIVNLASVAGITAAGSSIPYCASKAAVINLTVSLARAFGPKIRVNAIAPGFIAGRWTRDGLGPNYESTKLATEKKAVLGKVCTPEDVADAILALIGGSDMVTGQIIVCDGGAVIGAR